LPIVHKKPPSNFTLIGGILGNYLFLFVVLLVF
jgi:hypothetical protein